MKKMYKNPEMEIIMVKAQQLLAGSEIDGNRNFGNGSGLTIGGRSDDDNDW